ncbi:hypothetical protein AB0F11_30430 [Streptomyces sp. NPDC032472]|uniref:hypothetical protein n=1 Tax=Streptomyces sp. NPDC032472 TaxID=3155018 RepID=UPI0033D97A93
MLLDETDWGALQTAFGSGENLPDILLRLLEPDPAVQVAALSELGELIHHQNTIYEATAPAVMYVASILSPTSKPNSSNGDNRDRAGHTRDDRARSRRAKLPMLRKRVLLTAAANP